MVPRSGPRVAVAGGGIAGITAALGLAQRGYAVTLYEAGARLGGCLGAECEVYPGDPAVAVNYEVSPHMFGEWYHNFFALVGQAGLFRGVQFQACPQVAFVRRGRPLEYSFLTNNGALDTDFANIFSGVAQASDMFLYYYTLLDILTQDFSRGAGESLRNEQTLNGFIVTRPYVTERVARFFEEALVNIWAVDSFRTSIYAFQCAAKYQGRRPTPTSWTITDTNSYDLIIVALRQLLVDRGVEIVLDTAVLGVTVEGGRVRRICVGALDPDRSVAPSSRPIVAVDELVIAVPQHATGPMIVTSAEAAHERGPKRAWDVAEAAAKVTIAANVPSLAHVRSIEQAQLATLYIPFTRAFAGVPACYVGLVGSNYSLTFIRVPYLERALGVAMVLAVGISDFVGIPVDARELAPDLAWKSIPKAGPADRWTPAAQEAIALVVAEFRRYVDFPDDAVVWEQVFLKTNSREMLFLNTVGSRADAPDVRYDDVAGLYFAVGTKDNPITIATVECAVVGGLQAAGAVWGRNPRSRHNTVDPIVPVLPETYDPAFLWAWKIGLAPWAVAAKCWSEAQSLLGEDALPPGREGGAVLAPVAVVTEQLLQAAMTSVTASFTFWATMGRAFWGGRRQ